MKYSIDSLKSIQMKVNIRLGMREKRKYLRRTNKCVHANFSPCYKCTYINICRRKQKVVIFTLRISHKHTMQSIEGVWFLMAKQNENYYQLRIKRNRDRDFGCIHLDNSSELLIIFKTEEDLNTFLFYVIQTRDNFS